MLHLGLGFFTPENPRAGVPRHLWFILSDPARSDRVVISNVSTKRCTSGEVCEVAPGEHEHVSLTSYLRLDKVRVEARADLEKASGAIKTTSDASPTLLVKFQKAVLASRAVPKEAQQILLAQGFPPP